MARADLPHLLRVQEFDALVTADDLGPAVELLDGEVVEMPQADPAHVHVTETMGDLLKVRLAGLVGTAFVVRTQAPVVFPPCQEPVPDLVIARGGRDRYLQHHPGPDDLVLVVEIADTTFRRDNGRKRAIYDEAGIPHYWILDLPRRRVVCFELGEEGYGAEPARIVSEPSGPSAALTVAETSVTLTLAEILPPPP